MAPVQLLNAVVEDSLEQNEEGDSEDEDSDSDSLCSDDSMTEEQRLWFLRECLVCTLLDVVGGRVHGGTHVYCQP